MLLSFTCIFDSTIRFLSILNSSLSGPCSILLAGLFIAWLIKTVMYFGYTVKNLKVTHD